MGWALVSIVVFPWVPLWTAIVTAQDALLVATYAALFAAGCANNTRPPETIPLDGVDTVHRVSICFACLAALDSSIRTERLVLFASFVLFAVVAGILSQHQRLRQNWAAVEAANAVGHLLGSAALLVAIV